MNKRNSRKIGLGLVGLANVLGVSVLQSTAQADIGLNWFDLSGVSSGKPIVETSSDASVWQKWHGGVNVAVADLDGDGIPDICVTPGQGNSPELRTFDYHIKIKGDLIFGDITDKRGVTVAAGPFEGVNQDLVVGPASAGSELSTLLWNGKDKATLTVSPLSFNPGFTNGVNVAAADVNGDGKADIIVGNGGQGGDATGGARVMNGWDLATGKKPVAFAPYDKYNGGIHVAAGDVDGDQVPDLVTIGDPDSTGTSELAVFQKLKDWAFGGGSGGDNPTESRRLEVHNLGSSGQDGVSIAVGDVNGDGRADIVVGAGAGAEPMVQVFSLDPNAPTGFDLIDAFLAYDPSFLGGVNVAVGDLNGDGFADIVTAPASEIPEPASVGLVIGAVMLGCVRRRRNLG